MNNGRLGQRNHLEHGRADVPRPGPWQGIFEASRDGIGQSNRCRLKKFEETIDGEHRVREKTLSASVLASPVLHSSGFSGRLVEPS